MHGHMSTPLCSMSDSNDRQTPDERAGPRTLGLTALVFDWRPGPHVPRSLIDVVIVVKALPSLTHATVLSPPHGFPPSATIGSLMDIEFPDVGVAEALLETGQV
jgi:hypothetical protein